MSKSKYLTDSTSRWLVGSSSNSTLHGVRQNAASATRAFSPPESVPISRSAFSPVKPNAPITARQRSSETPDSRFRTWRGKEVSLYTILALPILYGVRHQQGGSGGGSYLAQKSRNRPITARQRSSETPDSRSRTRRGEEARVGLYTILECQYQYCILNCKTGGFMGNHILPNIDCKVQRKGNTEGV